LRAAKGLRTLIIMLFPALFNPAELPAALARPVVALGNFDGVHRGHQAVIGAALALARTLQRPALMLTFDPHPRIFFAPERPLARLTPGHIQASLCQELGLSGMVTLRFDAELAALEADDFVRSILRGRFAIAGAAIGHDFRFGRARKGSPEGLKAAGEALGFAVSIVPPVSDGDEVISSSAIRLALAQGQLATANRLLGYEYRLSGDVIHGRKLGRTIGYPTANIALPPDSALRHGIYAVRVKRRGQQCSGQQLSGVASFGRRPTFDNGPPLFEVYIFDFDGDLYGETLDIALVAWLRDEMKFDGIEPLLRQMDADSLEARRILSA
jgi:riboflavin kinase / FMN adenylyltransferase